jgi:hypothetical protein
MLVRMTPARLKRPEIPFPRMVVSRAIPGTDLKIGDAYPDPGGDKRARLRAALYFEQRRIVPATPPLLAASRPPLQKEKKNGTVQK